MDRFSQSLHHMKPLYVQMTRNLATGNVWLIFQFIKGRCHGNQIILQKCYQHRVIPLEFVALVLENELQYHDLAVLINSGNDCCISCGNFVKLGSVTPELTELICERLVRHCNEMLKFISYCYKIVTVFTTIEINEPKLVHRCGCEWQNNWVN